MTDKEKLIKIKSLADKMYNAAFNMTTNASLLRKAMDDYHQFIINEYHKEVSVSENKCMFTKDSYTDEDRKVLCKDCKEKCEYSKKEEPISEDTMTIRKEWFEHCKESWYNEGYIDGKYNRDRQFKEPVSEDLEDASRNYADNEEYGDDVYYAIKAAFKAGANWQKGQFEKDYADLCKGIITAKGFAVTMAYNSGVSDAKKQMTKDATEVTVHIDAGGYPYIPQMELYDYDKDAPLAKEGDKYKVILIKED